MPGDGIDMAKMANSWGRKRSLQRYRNLRREVLEFFGGVCVECGFSDFRALQLDHINGGGTAERNSLPFEGVFKRALKFPDEYQLLCANCNWIKRYVNSEWKGQK